MGVAPYKGEEFNFGERLRTLRENRGINQSELARRLDVARSTVSAWESNRTEPNMATLSKICEILHCGKSELVYGETEDNGSFTVPLSLEEEMLVDAWRNANMTSRMLAYQTLLKSALK